MAVCASWQLRARTGAQRVVEVVVEDGTYGYRCVGVRNSKRTGTVWFYISASREEAMADAGRAVEELCASRFRLTGHSVRPVLDLQQSSMVYQVVF